MTRAVVLLGVILGLSGPARGRDRQVWRVYQAEDTLADQVPSSRLGSLAACQAYVERLERQDWFIAQFGSHRFRVHRARGEWAWADDAVNIYLPRWAWTEDSILHEVAHGVTALDQAPHGLVFVRNRLFLVRRVRGERIYRRLRADYDRCRVRYPRPLDKPSVGGGSREEVPSE